MISSWTVHSTHNPKIILCIFSVPLFFLISFFLFFFYILFLFFLIAFCSCPAFILALHNNPTMNTQLFSHFQMKTSSLGIVKQCNQGHTGCWMAVEISASWVFTLELTLSPCAGPSGSVSLLDWKPAAPFHPTLAHSFSGSMGSQLPPHLSSYCGGRGVYFHLGKD